MALVFSHFLFLSMAIKSMDLILTVTFNNFCLGFSKKKIDVDGSEIQITV